MQLASVAPTTASFLSKQRKKFKVLGEHDARQDKVKLLRFLVPPLVAAVVALSPISNPPVSVGETVDVHKGATLFRRSCIGCHDAGGNIIQPGATLFLNDLQRNGVQTEEEIYGVTYYGKGRMPGFGENCTPRGQCAHLGHDCVKMKLNCWPNLSNRRQIKVGPTLKIKEILNSHVISFLLFIATMFSIFYEFTGLYSCVYDFLSYTQKN